MSTMSIRQQQHTLEKKILCQTLALMRFVHNGNVFTDVRCRLLSCQKTLHIYDNGLKNTLEPQKIIKDEICL